MFCARKVARKILSKDRKHTSPSFFYLTMVGIDVSFKCSSKRRTNRSMNENIHPKYQAAALNAHFKATGKTTRLIKYVVDATREGEDNIVMVGYSADFAEGILRNQLTEALVKAGYTILTSRGDTLTFRAGEDGPTRSVNFYGVERDAKKEQFREYAKDVKKFYDNSVVDCADVSFKRRRRY